MSAKHGEGKFLEKWIRKAGALGKRQAETKDGSGNAEDMPSRLEQLNLKVPPGTRERLRRLGLSEGGLSMRRMFKRMLDEFEARGRDKTKR